MCPCVFCVGRRLEFSRNAVRTIRVGGGWNPRVHLYAPVRGVCAMVNSIHADVNKILTVRILGRNNDVRMHQ